MNDHENNHDGYEHEPDNPIAPAASAGAMVSLEALGAVLNTVDTATIAGRSGLPMLQFKREGDGTWLHGQRRTVVEDGSRWAVNPLTFKRGYICFSDANKVVGERLLPVSQPMPDPSELPDKGFPWVAAMGGEPEVPRRRRRRRRRRLQADDRRRHSGHRRTGRGGARPPQRQDARRQDVADRASR